MVAKMKNSARILLFFTSFLAEFYKQFFTKIVDFVYIVFDARLVISLKYLVLSFFSLWVLVSISF